MESMDDYPIPARYNPVIDHFREQGDFEYLKFDGERFLLSLDHVKKFYLDLKDKLPKGELIKRGLLRSSAFWGKWKTETADDEIFDFTDMEEEITPERMRAIILEEEELPLPEPEEEEKGITWKSVGFVVLMILAILFILLIVIGVTVASGEPPFPGGGGGGGLFGKKKKGEG